MELSAEERDRISSELDREEEKLDSGERGADSFDVIRIDERVILSFRFASDNPICHNTGPRNGLDVTFDPAGLELLIGMLAEALADVRGGAALPN